MNRTKQRAFHPLCMPSSLGSQIFMELKIPVLPKPSASNLGGPSVMKSIYFITVLWEWSDENEVLKAQAKTKDGAATCLFPS